MMDTISFVFVSCSPKQMEHLIDLFYIIIFFPPFFQIIGPTALIACYSFLISTHEEFFTLEYV